MDTLHVVSGCSGGGKSTLLSTLQKQGFPVFKEAGREIVASEQAHGGSALPWIDLAAFAERAIAQCLEDFRCAAQLTGPVFFDRSLIDAVTAYEHATGSKQYRALLQEHRYARTVFFAPPWQAIYRTDAERQHGFAEACAEVRRLEHAYSKAGYSLLRLPECPVTERAYFILNHI
ncbi:AAA family ATPase [Pseudovibrio exalbescens]|uniref:AAA family ATPase n=1 Tax=Pseudovibrio exalbescens TaxID=197461 RepID=UPI000C9BA5F9|nr:AAA family ATPase [Pseudovibrio exalbescens]